MTPISLTQQAPLPRRPYPIVAYRRGGIVNDAHLRLIERRDFRLPAFFDLDFGRARLIAEKFGIAKVYSSLAQAVSEAPADAVFDVAVPPGAILQVLPALPDGRAVLIQKPMGQTLAEARDILSLCRCKQLKAAVNFSSVMRRTFLQPQLDRTGPPSRDSRYGRSRDCLYSLASVEVPGGAAAGGNSDSQRSLH